MSSLGAIGATSAAQAARSAAGGAAQAANEKDDKAEFQKKLTETALRLAANVAMDAQETVSDLDDDDE